MDAELEVDLAIVAQRWASLLPGTEELVRTAARAAWAAAGEPIAAEVSVLMSDDAAIRALNRKHRHRDQATNVLAFPSGDDIYPDGPRHLGDIILACETVCREAERDGKILEAHVAHLVVHGVLHLLGHDHQSPAEAEEMETIEISVLAGLGYGNPYLELADAAE